MRYLAEFYRPAQVAALDEVAAAARAAAEQVSGNGGAVRFLTAIYAREDESCFMLYQAGSADLVAAAGELAGLSFDRIVEVATSDPAG